MSDEAVASQLEALGFWVGSPALVAASIVAFQRCASLVVDGIAGPITLEALERTSRQELAVGRIPSAELLVGDRPFVAWFEGVRKARPNLFPYPLSADGFTRVSAHLSVLGMGVGLSAAELFAMFSIVYNETGGTFGSRAELGGPGYCFGTNGGKKSSYNLAVNGNRLAGDQLAARGLLRTPLEIRRWNTTSWPNPPQGSDLYQAALECDFYKYRGHALCQITWRNAHIAYADPAIALVSDRTSEQMTTEELDAVLSDDPTVYCLATAWFFHDPNWAGPALSKVNQGDFETLGRRVSGSTSYATLCATRCKALLEEAQDGLGIAEPSGSFLPPQVCKGRAS